LRADPDDEDSEIDIRPVLAKLAEQRDYVVKAVRAFVSHPTPVNVLARCVGRNVFETMGILSEMPSHGVRWCCLGNKQERDEAIKACSDNRTVVIDSTALYSIWKLGIPDLLLRWGTREFVVTQSTSDELHGLVEAQTTLGPQGRMGLDEQGRFFASKPNEEETARHVESLRQFESHINETCKVVTVLEAANLPPDQRQRITEMFGRDGLESIVLAAKPGHILWSDDMLPFVFLREDFSSTRWAWTQLFLHTAVENGVLDVDQFETHSARLMGMGYRFTWSTVGIIVRAGALANWNCNAPPLKELIRQFGSLETDFESKLQLAAFSIVEMFRTTSSRASQWAFIQAILDSVLNNAFAPALSAGVKHLFGDDVASAKAAVSMIEDWRGPWSFLAFPQIRAQKQPQTFDELWDEYYQRKGKRRRSHQ
jgi:hypothetical protein